MRKHMVKPAPSYPGPLRSLRARSELIARSARNSLHTTKSQLGRHRARNMEDILQHNRDRRLRPMRAFKLREHKHPSPDSFANLRGRVHEPNNALDRVRGVVGDEVLAHVVDDVEEELVQVMT